MLGTLGFRTRGSRITGVSGLRGFRGLGEGVGRGAQYSGPEIFGSFNAYDLG